MTNIEKIIEDFDKQFIGQLAEYDTTEGAGGYDPRPYIHEFITKAYQAGIQDGREETISEIIKLFVPGWESGSIKDIKEYAKSKGIVLSSKE